MKDFILTDIEKFFLIFLKFWNIVKYSQPIIMKKHNVQIKIA